MMETERQTAQCDKTAVSYEVRNIAVFTADCGICLEKIYVKIQQKKTKK